MPGTTRPRVGKMHFYPWDARHGFQYRVICEDKLWTNIRDDYHHYLRERGRKKLPWNEYGDYLEKKGAATTDIPWEDSWDRYTGREARRFIENYSDDGPFAMMVGFPGPHDPYDPAVDFPEQYDPDDMPDPVPAADDDPGGLRRPTSGAGRVWEWTLRTSPSRRRRRSGRAMPAL